VRPVGGISIMPAPAGLESGDSFALVAVIRGQHGTRLPPRAVEWSTDAPSVLRIDGASGIASAVASGSAVVTATCKGITALLRVEVAPPRADDIVIEPMNEALHVGEEIRLDATPQDKRGWPVPRAVTWQSADPAVAAVTADGAIAGRAPGTVRITAALDDARASIVIPVLPPRVAIVDIADPPVSVVAGQTFLLAARTLDLMNAPLPGRALLWSTSDVSVAVVTAEGLVAALQPGSVVLTATCEGVRASVRIGVVAESPAAVTAPEVRHAPRRRSRRARRQALLAGGTALSAGLLWLWLAPAPVAGPAVGATGNDGRAGYLAAPVGTDTSPPSTVVITRRPSRALRPDSATALAAEVRDTAGRIVEGAAVWWSSSDTTVARVDRATGRVVALRPGRTQVVAANGRGRDSVVIAVRRAGARAPVAGSIAIAALQPLPTGNSALLAAVVLGPAGDTLAGAEVTWASGNPQVATVEPLTGMARGHAPGTTLILARSGNQTSAAELTVVAGAVAALEVLGARPMAVSETLALRVAARDREGKQVSDFPVAWASSNESVAAVDEGTGAVVGRAPGSVRIMAAAGVESAWTQLTVLPRPERLRAQDGNSERRQAETWVAAGVEQCYGALQSRNLARLGLLWRPVSRSDEDNLKQLTRILRTPELEAVVGERTDRPPTIGPQAATAEFTAPLTWRESSAGPRTSHLVFRAGFVRTLDRWELSSCRVVGSPRL
ncbi:MAG: Ig-like domain-containing protein, partial [Gemmatimonadota bacterium]|nr:Ig-like domain-containing protein [Gemmatimonadota bacterium]